MLIYVKKSWQWSSIIKKRIFIQPIKFITEEKEQDFYVSPAVIMSQSENYRVLLNDHCQKHSMIYPKFNTEKVAGDEHQPLFQCKLIFEYKSYTSALLNTKSKCEEEICRKIYQDLDIKYKKDSGNIKIHQNLTEFLRFLDQEKKSKSSLKLMIIDLENVSNIDWDNVKNYENSHTIVVVKGVSGSAKIQRTDIVLSMLIAQSSGKDAADTLMILIVGASYTIIDEYIIISKDHFAATLKDIVYTDNVKFKLLYSI